MVKRKMMVRNLLLGFVCLILLSGFLPLTLPTSHAEDGAIYTAETPESLGGPYQIPQSSEGIILGPYIVHNNIPSPAGQAIGTTLYGFNFDKTVQRPAVVNLYLQTRWEQPIHIASSGL